MPNIDMHIYEENFDEVTAPNLPTGWSTSSSPEGVPVWVTSTTDPFSPPNCAFGVEPNSPIGSLVLQSPKISIPSNGATLTFENSYNFDAASSQVIAIAFQGDQILVGGLFSMLAPNEAASYTRVSIVRLNADGTVDTSFVANTNLGGDVNTIVVQPDNKILIGGFFTHINGVPRINIARLLANGSVDPTFQLNTDANATSFVQQIIYVNNTHIYVVGSFTMIGGKSLPQIAKFDINGTLDSHFMPSPDNVVLAIVAQPVLPSGFKIVVGGDFTKIGGHPFRGVAKLDPETGAAIPSFHPNPTVGVLSLILQPNTNQIIMGGGFTLAGQSFLARLNNPDGTLDTTFLPKLDMEVNGIAIQTGLTGDKILITGEFHHVNTIAKNFCARLTLTGSTDTTFTADLNNSGNVIAYQPTGISSGIYIGGLFQTINGVQRKHMGKTDLTGTVQDFDPNFTFSGAANSGTFMKISLDGGMTFKQITDAGATFITGGYNAGFFNPTTGSSTEGWSGDSNGYITTSLLLPANLHALSNQFGANITKSVIFQWVIQFISPNPPPNAGSRIDNIVIDALPICVHPDMKVALQNGSYKLVKEIVPGDILITRKGRSSTVVINHRNSRPHISLVTFEENSISPGVPNESLLITSNHPIVVKGKYIKPLALVNGKNIIKSKTKKPVHTHTLVTDNGLPVLIHNVEVSTWHINSWMQKENPYEVNDYI